MGIIVGVILVLAIIAIIAIIGNFNEEAKNAKTSKNITTISITFIEVLFYILAGISLVYSFVYCLDYDNWTNSYSVTLRTETYIGFRSFVFNLFCASVIMWLRKIYNRLCQ